jgi:hypothetical protein
VVGVPEIVFSPFGSCRPGPGPGARPSIATEGT